MFRQIVARKTWPLPDEANNFRFSNFPKEEKKEQRKKIRLPVQANWRGPESAENILMCLLRVAEVNRLRSNKTKQNYFRSGIRPTSVSSLHLYLVFERLFVSSIEEHFPALFVAHLFQWQIKRAGHTFKWLIEAKERLLDETLQVIICQ